LLTLQTTIPDCKKNKSKFPHLPSPKNSCNAVKGGYPASPIPIFWPVEWS
jgi:hypothetical protein